MTEEEQLALALQMSMSGMMEGAMETELTSATDQVRGVCVCVCVCLEASTGEAY